MPPPSSLPPPLLIEDEAEFGELLDELSRADVVAVDTEADSFFNYREKVCLIQVTAGERDFVVDPLAGFDVTPLGEVLADEGCTKVFHDGEYDILILKRDYGFDFANLFDTRIAAAALGEPNPGLASVLKKYFDVELDKSLQRSDWSRRPLGPEQISYARLDTHFLIPLMETFEEGLERLDRSVIVQGECERLTALEPVERSFNPDEFVRIKGVRDLSGEGKQALRELYVLRDRLAEDVNRPPFKVLSNQVLIEVARSAPKSIKSLSGIPGLSSRMLRRMGDDILDAVDRARELGPMKSLPQLPSRDGLGVLDDEAYELHERLRQWRKERADSEGIDSSLVLNRHVMLELAQARPASLERLADVDGIRDWQLERFGAELVELVLDFERDLAEGRVVPTRGRRSRRDAGR